MTKQFTKDERGCFKGRVVRPFDKFVQYKLPFPMDPIRDVYRQAFTDKEWVAMRYLQENKPKALKKEDSFTVFWTDDTSMNSRCPYVQFKLPKDKRYPDIRIMLDELPDRVQGEFRNWLTSVNRMRSLRKELSERCTGIMGNPWGVGDTYIRRRLCDLDPKLNNPVQVSKLWPEVVPFLERDHRDEIRTSTLVTRLPSHVGYQVIRDDQKRWATMKEFRCEDEDCSPIERARWDELNTILIAVSMAKDLPEVDNYPDVNGPID